MLHRILIKLLLLFFTPAVLAHQFLPTRAELAVYSEKEYGLAIDIDLIELIQTVNGLEGTGEELIRQVRTLPFPQLIEALDKGRAMLQRDVQIYFDEQVHPVAEIQFPQHQDVLMMLRRTDVTIEYRITALSAGQIPDNVESVQVAFPEYLGAVNLTMANPRYFLVNAGDKSEKYSLVSAAAPPASVFSQILTYLYQGIIHIVPHGLDHILFVLALFLLSTNLLTLFWQVTAFTLAHTITLIMATYGVVSLSPDIVEPLIAFSIVFVAAENLYHSRLQAWRIVIVFLFGLLHGMGFASVLMDFGLPQSQLLASLIAFNVGVEIGQLLVIAAAFLVVGWFRKQHWYRQRIILPGSACIAAMGLYWTVTRVTAAMI